MHSLFIFSNWMALLSNYDELTDFRIEKRKPSFFRFVSFFFFLSFFHFSLFNIRVSEVCTRIWFQTTELQLHLYLFVRSYSSTLHTLMEKQQMHAFVYLHVCALFAFVSYLNDYFLRGFSANLFGKSDNVFNMKNV